ncbi:F0F1 ATP synthase subunit gamma [Nostoc sp. 'Peltigera membranacea cyanobiont' 232]|uniref:F0F1 ATP synthase subunit gamma n=1 Tax=Nostoc sp. 'Peltigera membranacea cyanobiont' 232 TaxID=2014531 RepID=UPI000B952A22|nr:F0F1 ATP synthase subunit gamma [Nostoc sp. 'Peltigera membranacea cyanobiont' 232]OYE00581.1 F0F1 ATP synthase subunit gamma [Nostoc sp. 'Peltigera membranacea cyanobiont' 232]
MSSIELLQRQIHTAQDLQAVVKMMKVLAALNIHQYQQAVASLAEYNRTIEMGLHVVLKAAHTHDASLQHDNGDGFNTYSPSLSSDLGRCGVIIFGSEQGMCGQFNEQISHYAIAELEKLKLSPEHLAIFAVGSRLISHLETAGYGIEQTFAMPGSLAGITSMVQEILPHIARWRDSEALLRSAEREQIGQITLFYNHLHSNTLWEPYKLQLLPLDGQWLQHIESQEWRSRTLPTFTMPSDVLVASLLRQYFFILLYRAFGESLAGENASRLASMQVAEKNIEERLTEFTSQFQQKRQTAITDELLEIISAFELSH